MPEPLLVPCAVQALVVNNPAVEKYQWSRQRPNLDDLQSAHNQSTTTTAVSAPDDYGVYVHWHLPQALRTGRIPSQKPPVPHVVDLGMDFPLVPNRWLVVRYHRPAGSDAEPIATGWMVHSDYLITQKEIEQAWENGEEVELGSLVLHPTEKDDDGYYAQAFMGRKVLLSENAAWTEPDNPAKLFLTSTGTGLAAFSEYQPYNENVFSLHDDLTDIADWATKAYTLSYLVIGWYSDPAQDIFTPDPSHPDRKDAATLLDRLRWQYATHASTENTHAALAQALGWDAATGPAGQPHALYCGTVLGLNWDLKKPTDPPPPSRLPKTVDDITFAVGPTPIEAQIAHLTQVKDTVGLKPEQIHSFEAFQNDWLEFLSHETVTQTALEHARQALRFVPQNGGHRWEIVHDSDAHLTTEAALRDHGFVAQLNARQQTYNIGLRELADAQQRLYGLWWMSKKEEDFWPEGTAQQSKAACEQQLNPTTSGTVAHTVQSKYLELFGADGQSGLHASLPLSSPDGDLATTLREYEKHNNLAGTLRCVSLPPFHLPQPATLVLHGLQGIESLSGPIPLPCRTPDQTITQITIDTTTIQAPATPPSRTSPIYSPAPTRSQPSSRSSTSSTVPLPATGWHTWGA
ncbi:hypothetical protein J4032_18230 [Streptomyces formicae]|uniref:Uncharacterized protein n=1 Tax=Streptomyces formicae TaxID=1616117 RepID=A0ABY3WKM8_9ACTN|nr:hypothetical protein [Streptomyces formicae]UNM13173.1 hypothetical protein J4032_18230 [Streptomyces formicae]